MGAREIKTEGGVLLGLGGKINLVTKVESVGGWYWEKSTGGVDFNFLFLLSYFN